MADNDRTYNYQPRYGRDRGEQGWQREDRDRFSDRRLDDRTSYGASGDRGYPADRAYQGRTDYGRDDEQGSTYGGYEDRSFSDQGRGGGYSDPYGYDRSSYRGSDSAREYQTQRPAMRQNHDSQGFGGRQRSYRGPDQGRESYDFNPYQGYSGGGVTSEFGFGQWDDERQARERWENRDRDRNRGGQQHRGRDQDEGFFERMGRKMANWFDGDDNRSEYRGEHSGRGPKGYRRSDDRIREDVSDRLTDDAWLDASDIEVLVAECEVTLVGTVNDRESKRRAEQLAEAISGVKHVQNNLRVSQLNQGTSSTTATGAGSASTTTSGSGVIESEASGVAANPTLNKQAAGRA